jgi:putative exosortase-associated protein (TIGR04073 family)
MRWSAVWLAFVVVVMAQPAWAARTPVHAAAESADYKRKFCGMIGRGLLNASTSFVDLLVNVVNETRSGPPLVGTLVGVGKGTACSALRALSGAVDLVTFWVPGFHGFPVSDSYEDCLASAAMHAEPVAPPASLMEEPAEDEFPAASPGAAPSKQEKPRHTK